MNEVRTLLETLAAQDDETRMANIKPFITPTLERLKKSMKPKVEKSKLLDPLYKYFIEIWDEFYHGLLTMPRDGLKIKSIIRMTGEVMRDMNRDITPDGALKFWRWFVSSLKGTFHHNKDLCYIESKFKSIVKELLDKRNGQTTTTRPNGQRFAQQL